MRLYLIVRGEVRSRTYEVALRRQSCDLRMVMDVVFLVEVVVVVVMG